MSVNTIKFYKLNQVPMAKLNGTEYKGYTVGNLPNRFGVKYIDNGEKVKPGISSWFKHKGLTYIEVTKSFWSDIAKQNHRDNVEMLFRNMK